MALKSQVSTPLDQLTQTEWRNTIATWCGVAYDNLASAAQTELDRIVNEAIEYASERAAHHPWGTREYTATITAGTDTTYDMPVDFRHWVVATEETSTAKVRVTTAYDIDFMDAHDGSGSHPWASHSTPVYFFNGLTDDAPAKQQWRRIGVDNTGATLRVRYRPYFSLLQSSGENNYPTLPASEVPVIREHARALWAAFLRDFETAQFHKSNREEAIQALEINDRVTTEDPYLQGFDSQFSSQLGD